MPTELTHLIAQNLDTFDRMRLRISCPALYAIIPPPTLNELFKLEYTDLDCLLNFYTCATCKRLRPRGEFADSMVKKRRSKLSLSQDVRKRFCIDCGIEPDPIYGSRRYTPGSQIAIFGQQFAVCRSCWKFDEAAVEDGRNTSECIPCRTIPGAREQHARRIEEERRAREQAGIPPAMKLHLEAPGA